MTNKKYEWLVTIIMICIILLSSLCYNEQQKRERYRLSQIPAQGEVVEGTILSYKETADGLTFLLESDLREEPICFRITSDTRFWDPIESYLLVKTTGLRVRVFSSDWSLDTRNLRPLGIYDVRAIAHLDGVTGTIVGYEDIDSGVIITLQPDDGTGQIRYVFFSGGYFPAETKVIDAVKVHEPDLHVHVTSNAWAHAMRLQTPDEPYKIDSITEITKSNNK